MIKYFSSNDGSCPACRIMAPRIEEFAEEYEVEFFYTNEEDGGTEAAAYGIRSIPTMIVGDDRFSGTANISMKLDNLKKKD